MLMPVRARVVQVIASITGVTGVSDWLQVTDSDPGPSTAFPVQNIERKVVVPSSFDWTTEPV
jgi:hypothetical protein